MITRSLALLAVTGFIAVAAPATAGACCGCAYTCAPPPQVQIWGLSPTYVMNQGPVFSGPGFYTAPTFEGESLTVDYPYVGAGDYPRYQRPYDGGPYVDPFSHRRYHNYWEGVLPVRPHHFAVLPRHEAGVVYRQGFGRRAIVMSGDARLALRGHRDFRDPRLR
jgi:hypothetical protein